jgi:photosystem II stability/assembly factor-like uncharacterized protein
MRKPTLLTFFLVLLLCSAGLSLLTTGKAGAQRQSARKPQKAASPAKRSRATKAARAAHQDRAQTAGKAAEQRKVREVEHFDDPDAAAEFFLQKRLPQGETELPAERYIAAREKMRGMRQYSTAGNRFLPSRNEMANQAAPEELDALNLGAWSWLGPGNVGGRTRALLIHPTTPNTMYAAGVAGGVWKTTDGGASWTPLTDMIANLAVVSLALDPSNPNIIYAGTGEFSGSGEKDLGTGVRGAGIFKTTDGGMNWTHLANTNSSNFYYVNKLVVSPNTGQRVYAATGTGVWRSTDGGTNWTKVHNQPTCQDMVIRTDQAIDFIFVTCRPSNQGRIYRNTNANGAGTWDEVHTETGMGRTSLALAPSNQSVIYAMAASTVPAPPGNRSNGLHAVFRSTSNGDPNTWTPQVQNTNANLLNTLLLTNVSGAYSAECGWGDNFISNQGSYDNVIAVDPLDPNRVWAGGIYLFCSDDGGANWGYSPCGPHVDMHAIVFHPQYDGTSNQTMFVGNDGGVARTTNARSPVATVRPCDVSCAGFVSFTNLNNNYGVTQYYHGTPYPDGTTYMGGAQDNGTTRGTDAGGINQWRLINGGDGGYSAVDPTNTSIIYTSRQSLSIYKTTNGNAQNINDWALSINGITNMDFIFIVPFIMDPSNSQRLWTGGESLWRTIDGAANWTQASMAVAGSSFNSVTALAVAPTDANYLLAGTEEGYIHRTDIGLSSNSATVWPNVQPRIGYVSRVAFDPTNKNIAYATYSNFGGTHIWKTTNAGASWTASDGTGATAIPDIPVHCVVVDPLNASRVFVGTDMGVFTSTDGGQTWAPENTGFGNIVTESLSVNSGGGQKYLFAFTHGRGAWRVPLSQSCSFNLSATTGIFTATGGAGSVNVTAPGGCNWTVVNNNPSFITVNSGNGGNGNSTVSFTVAANPGNTPRSGTLTIAGQTYTVHQVDFLDVPPWHPFFNEIHEIFLAGITLGCGGGNYCPDSNVTREQMAIFIERALGVFTPPTPNGQTFQDVPTNSYSYPFIEDFATRSITQGCAAGPPRLYCPTASVTREQMAIFLERALGVFNPPPGPATPTFADVPNSGATDFSYEFIEDFLTRGITSGCAAGPPRLYCPTAPVTRAQMAAFLSRAF